MTSKNEIPKDNEHDFYFNWSMIGGFIFSVAVWSFVCYLMYWALFTMLNQY